jgi:predicted naringenin-chalcone synthase
LRNILTLPVPELAANHASKVLDTALARQEIDKDDIRAWVMHAGGRKVLEALQRRIGLDGDDIGWSAAMLRRYGNLSSPFVLFVLQSALAANAPKGWWWMSSFGAGFSCHGALLEVA